MSKDAFGDLVSFGTSRKQNNVPLAQLQASSTPTKSQSPIAPVKPQIVPVAVQGPQTAQNVWNFDELLKPNLSAPAASTRVPYTPPKVVAQTPDKPKPLIDDDDLLFKEFNEMQKSAPSTVNRVPVSHKDSGKTEVPSSGAASPCPPPSQKQQDTSRDAAIALIVSNGYSIESAMEALSVCEGDAIAALELIQSNEKALNSIQQGKQQAGTSPFGKKGFGLSFLEGAQKLIDSSKKQIGKVVEKNESLLGLKSIFTTSNGSSSLGQGRRTPHGQGYSEDEDEYHYESRYRDEPQPVIRKDTPVSPVPNTNSVAQPKQPVTPVVSSGVAVDLLLDHDVSPVSFTDRPITNVAQPTKSVAQPEANLLDIFADHPIKATTPAAVASPAKSTFDDLFASATSSPAIKGVGAKPQNEVDQLKTTGNEFFKNGAYSDAVASYSAALQVAPPASTVYIQLLNNRAAAALKTGEYQMVVQDTTQVMEKSTDPQDIRKALGRRGAAFEGLEKWSEAREDYVRLVGMQGGKAASDGLSRCNKALNLDSPKNSPRPKPRNAATPNVSRTSKNAATVAQAVNQAVSTLREKEKIKSKEEDMKLSLQDDVDARLLAWKQGKEANVRALLSSLDMVLWPELQWKNVSLAELIQPTSVKKQYMKIVARIHPDKLGSGVTVEQRMIASAVFAVINKAWDEFRAANNL